MCVASSVPSYVKSLPATDVWHYAPFSLAHPGEPHECADPAPTQTRTWRQRCTPTLLEPIIHRKATYRSLCLTAKCPNSVHANLPVCRGRHGRYRQSDPPKCVLRRVLHKRHVWCVCYRLNRRLGYVVRRRENAVRRRDGYVVRLLGVC